MANTTRRDVELRINANDLSEKSLQQLLDTFEKLRLSQEALAKSGDGTQRSMRELKQDLSDLQAVALELKSRAALVDQFLAIEKRAGDAATRVEAAKAALQRFNAAQAQGAELTKKEQTEFTRLTREVQKAEKSFDANTAKLKEFKATLAQLGEGDTNQTREALLRFSTDLGASLAAAEQSIRKYDAALRASEQKERDATDAKREAAKAALNLKAAQDALAGSVAFNTQGREALKAASNIEALTRDYDKLAQSSRKAGDGIREILDPSRQALASLDGLEGEVKRLNAQLNSLQGSPRLAEELKQVRADYNALAADAGKAAASLVDDIGSYRKVEQSVAALRTRLEAAQQSVREFASQMAVTTEPSEKLSKDLSAAQVKLKGLVGEFEREAQVLATLRLRLREAGVDVDRLTEAEQRLQSVAVGVVESQRKIAAVSGRVEALTKATIGLKAAQDELEAGVAFNRLGRDALKAASAIDALTRDYDALVASTRKAGDSIRGIIDPSRQALASLGGLEAQTRQLNDQLAQAGTNNKLRDEVRRLRSEYGSLAADSGKAAAALADQIGAYRQNQQAVDSLRARVENAQQSVRKFASQMAVAASPSESLSKSLATAKAQLASLVGEFERQSTSLAKLRAELKEAGVETGKLAEAEQRLERVARGVVTAQQALGTAAVNVGSDAAKGAKGLKLFEDSGRKALSSAQRLRGEILSLASSYLGLFAAVNVAKGVVDVAISRETTLRQLELLTGSADAAKLKLEEVTKQTEEMGLVSLPAAAQYAKFALAMKAAGVAAGEADRAFFDALTIGKNLSLSGDQFERFATALHQMATLGRVGAEELNQAADAGVNLRAALADVMQLTSADFKEKSEAGLIGVHALSAGLNKLAKDTSAFKKSDKSIVDALRAFEDGVTKLKLVIADSGFLDTFVTLLKEAAAAIKSGELNDAAKGFGNLLRLAGEAARFLLENSDAVVAVFVGFIALNVGRLLVGLGKSFLVLAGAVRGSAVAMGVLRGAMTLLAAHPVAALIIALVSLVAMTDKGRAAMRGLWQILVEVNGALTALVALDVDAFAERMKNGMARVAAAFRGAKDDAEDLQNVVEGGVGGASKRQSGATGSWKEGGATGSWGDDPTALESKRRAQAELTQRTVADIEKKMADLRKASAQATARMIGDVEAEVRAEYQDTYDQIAKLEKEGTAEAIAAAKALKKKADADVAAIVKSRKAIAAKTLKPDERGEIADRLEQAKQRAEATKDGLALEAAELEQAYKEGLVSLREYHAKRLELTKAGLQAEIVAAREQIADLEENKERDPTAAKKITRLRGEIAGKEKQQELAERAVRLEVELTEKALRRQVSTLEQELKALTGQDREAALQAINDYYAEQLEVVKQLTGKEQDAAKATLDRVVALKKQLVEINALGKQADHIYALSHAATDAAVAVGDLTRVQELQARSHINAEHLRNLEAQAEAYRRAGDVGSEAYKAIELQIIKLQGETDLVGNEVKAVFKDAASSFVTTLMETKSPEKALSEFGKSLGNALSQAFVNAASKMIVKWIEQSGLFDFTKSLFSGLGSLGAGKAHTGAVVGYSGMTPVRVSPLAFIGAQRYHGGGLPGLRRDEVATILKRREEVLGVDDPRNVLNGGKQPQQASRAGPSRMMVQLDERALHMTMRDWLEREMATIGSRA